ncbi:MAG: hypothetical protein KDD37_00520 [Bdellovibrionales bacterium]|nr:hypothetical protein [Bdellovibrionales bacterium]
MKKWYAFVLLVFLAACAENKNISNQLQGQKSLLAPNEIRIIDEKGNPVTGATVQVGYTAEAFPNNVLTTDQNGIMTIPNEWKNEEPVTIIADNFIRATYLHQKPEANVFVVHTYREQPTQELKGITTGFGELKRDDKIDFGLVLPLMSKTTLFQFDMGLFISPDSDIIEIMGRKMSVPSNVSLPDQTERYLFFNIRFNKPQYRTYFHEAGEYELIAAHGQFPFKKMIGEFESGKGFTEVVNLFDFLEGGLHLATAPGSSDLVINDFKLQGKQTVKAPQIPEGFSYFASSLQTQNNLMYPADVKRLLSNESISLKMSPLSTENMLLAAVAKEEKLEGGATRLNPSMSIAILPFVSGVTQTYLPLVAEPKVNGENIVVTAPKADSFNQLGTYLSLQDVKIERLETEYVERVTKKWEIYSANWENEIRLPKVGSDVEIINNLRWESIFLATKASSVIATGPEMFDVAEYITRNATNL